MQSGMTPLERAVCEGHYETVEYFVENCNMDISQFDMVCNIDTILCVCCVCACVRACMRACVKGESRLLQRGYINEKGCTVTKPLSHVQLVCSYRGWVWEGVSFPMEVRKREELGCFVTQGIL